MDGVVLLVVMVSVREECIGLDVSLGITPARVCKEDREVLAIIGNCPVGGGCVDRRFEDITVVVVDSRKITTSSRKSKRSLPSITVIMAILPSLKTRNGPGCPIIDRKSAQATPLQRTKNGNSAL